MDYSGEQDVCHCQWPLWVKGYLRKYTIRYIANTRSKHKNTHCDYREVFILGFFFIVNGLLTTKPSQCLDISKNLQWHIARFWPLYLKSVMSRSVIMSFYCTLQVTSNPKIYLAIDQMTSHALKMLMLLVTFMVIGLVAFSSGEVELWHMTSEKWDCRLCM